jgi:hypothetical protein
MVRIILVKESSRRATPDVRVAPGEFSGGPGVYRFDLSSHYDLKDQSWRTDVIPAIMDGKNILDYVDADILERLDTLERWECACCFWVG